jgi:hypothetical protein
MQATATSQIVQHINGKILYHQKLLAQLEASEEYEKCVYHRDEIIRLKKML